MMTMEQILSRRVYFWLIVFIEATLFFPLKVSVYAISLLVIFWLIQLYKVPGKPALKEKFWVLPLLFFLFVVGLVFTSNMRQGLKEIEERVTFVILPLIFYSSKISLTKNDVTKLIVYFFNIGLAVGAGLLIVAVFHYLNGAGPKVFFYEDLTHIVKVHPVYFSYYILFGLLGRFVILYQTHYKNLVFWLSNLAGIALLVLLASKMVISILFLVTVFLLARYLRVSALYKVFAIIIFTAILVGSIFLLPEVEERVSSVFDTSISDLTQETYAYNYPFNGISLRLVVWKLALQHMYHDGLLLFGVGTGDSADYLNTVYEQHGLIKGGFTNHNAHNEYVQTLLMLGLAGFFYLSFIFLLGFYTSYTEKNSILFVFTLILGFASWSESLLTVNKGIVFLALFYPILQLFGKLKHA